MDFRLAPGELVAIVGPNGAGKTTLLRVLSSECSPDIGTAQLDGVALDRWAPRLLARRRAVLPQETSLDFPLSALEVALMGRMPHARSSRDRQLALAALHQADAAHLAHRIYPTLSGGERQRVQLARVLCQLQHDSAQDPCYLLLDEPTAALDLAHQYALLRTVRQLVATGFGGLAILHDLNLAAQFADRIVVMAAGRVVAEGNPGTVLVPELIRQVYAVDCVVARHPRLAVPHVIPLPAVSLDQDQIRMGRVLSTMMTHIPFEQASSTPASSLDPRAGYGKEDG
ncbi:heme ABC transporter ATP-binding protein [Thioalkalivibrio nitratireducens]|uniref:heme ABC transporter ATP-binding protein n=1 Tax=Thioalkalivibrio nitratireducens TaxID=186931 RepID=UPI001EEF75DF|nr:heme ABC transporter ATP-binding protein [Thioalkalivibrio nitratireducens]